MSFKVKILPYSWPLVFLSGLFFISFLLFFWQNTIIYLENISLSERFDAVVNQKAKKPNQMMAKGLYLTAYSAGIEPKINEIIKLLIETELNSVVIDIKDYSGYILYDSQLPIVNELNLKKNQLGDLKALIKKLHEQNIYVIARQTVFQDPILAEKKKEWAIKNKPGGLWRDYKGLSWVDPTKKEVWDYNLAIAKEAIAYGFDEINFDYMRFPSDGNMSSAVYAIPVNKKYEIMKSFYEFLNQSLKNEPVWTSIDMFGFVMEKSDEDDMNIGQRLEDALDNFDYVCPMMYPSHYPAGHLGLKNPADYPGLVIENGMKLGAPRFANRRAQLRPWLQAFNIGAVYNANKIRAQIDKTEEYTTAGWLLWNASNRYTSAGLR